MDDTNSEYALIPHWPQIMRRYESWWKREGLVLWLTTPRQPTGGSSVNGAVTPETRVTRPRDLVGQWTDPAWRVMRAEREFASTWYGGEAHARFDPQLGPGNLASFLGSEPRYDTDTVWFDPCISDPERHPSLSFDPTGRHFCAQMALVEAGLVAGRGRYPVTLPDLIENVDILVSLRGMEHLLEDMADRPGWIVENAALVNSIWFDVFERMRSRIVDTWGGNHWGAFCLWGKGRTAKLQCDASAAFGPPHFRRFVAPSLTAQCRGLDNSLYHLDGTQCLCHLDAVLAIDELDAIEWTPQAGLPGGGDPRWFDIYRRILAAGKCVQAVGVEAAEVIPLLDAVGPKGMFIIASAATEEEGLQLEQRVDAYRSPGI